MRLWDHLAIKIYKVGSFLWYKLITRFLTVDEICNKEIQSKCECKFWKEIENLYFSIIIFFLIPQDIFENTILKVIVYNAPATFSLKFLKCELNVKFEPQELFKVCIYFLDLSEYFVSFFR